VNNQFTQSIAARPLHHLILQNIPEVVEGHPTNAHKQFILCLLPYFPAYKTHFSPGKCDLNSSCVLCAEGITSKLINTQTLITHLYRDMILVAATMIFWLSVMNKYIMVDNFGM
jgi:hypothetical protein